MKNDKFGDRMKSYEKASYGILEVEPGMVNPDMPVFVRLDGKAFHTYTKNFRKAFAYDANGTYIDFDEHTSLMIEKQYPELMDKFKRYYSDKFLNDCFEKPFDSDLSYAFQLATLKTCESVGQVIMAYSQSDEITFLLNGWQRPESQIYFGGKIQKIVSVMSSIFTGYFNYALNSRDYPAVFDARVFNVPVDEIENVFIWRQMDAKRNSVQGLARSLYSHKELHKKGVGEMIEMARVKGHEWNDLSNLQKWGFVVKKEEYMVDETVRTKWIVDTDIPYFVDESEYLSDIISVE